METVFVWSFKLLHFVWNLIVPMSNTWSPIIDFWHCSLSQICVPSWRWKEGWFLVNSVVKEMHLTRGPSMPASLAFHPDPFFTQGLQKTRYWTSGLDITEDILSSFLITKDYNFISSDYLTRKLFSNTIQKGSDTKESIFLSHKPTFIPVLKASVNIRTLLGLRTAQFFPSFKRYYFQFWRDSCLLNMDSTLGRYSRCFCFWTNLSNR